MRVGVVCLATDPWWEWSARARHLGDLGYEHLWTYDHLSWRQYADGPWHASLPLLTATAAVTSRIRLGTRVGSPDFRHPVTLAEDALTLDEISGGRQGARLEEECARAGRDPSTVDRTFPAHQSPVSRVEHLGEVAHSHAALGVTDVVFHHPRSDDPRWNDTPAIVDAIARQVIPALR
ncbi:MAG TPA: LLM class flavin-dependent oxidoreductase [Mycobacteriales bacterium]|nr:LLM class flavin-dependent oxidoreductase [Mycobacteriales bacterium]